MQLTPKLNYDILLEVMKACSRDDCARLMQTCSSLRNNGHKVLLSHPLQFYVEKDILRFLQYLQPQSDKRAKHVRSMHFYMGVVELSESTALALAAALPMMHDIQELWITDSEYFLSSHPVLSRATGALTSLRSLHLTDMGEFAVKMLRSLRSELTDVLLDYDVETLSYGSQEELVGLSELLAHSQATLQEIAINRWYALPDTWESGELGVAFPETRRLIIGQSLYPPFALSYACAFPALSHLSVRTGESEMFDAEDIREWNISQLRDPGCAWKALEDLDGNLVEIYALALPCTVERVHLGEITPDHLFMLGPALSDARPRHLRMDNWPIGWTLEGAASDLFAALRGHGGSRLEMLALEVGLSYSDSDVDVAAALVRTRLSQAVSDETNPVGHRRKNCLPPLRRVRPYKSCD